MDDLVLGAHIIPGREMEELFETHGGPGGQHANRNQTAVRLRFDIGASSLPEQVKTRLVDQVGEVVEVISAESRSQFRNRALARRRLKEKLEAALVEETPRKATNPTRESRRRRLDQKRARARTKRLRRPPEDDF